MIDATDNTPAATPPTATPPPDPAQVFANLSRRQAQGVATKLFGPAAFARKKTKTNPGQRCEIALRGQRHRLKRIIGRGSNWFLALKDAAAWADRTGWVSP